MGIEFSSIKIDGNRFPIDNFPGNLIIIFLSSQTLFNRLSQTDLRSNFLIKFIQKRGILDQILEICIITKLKISSDTDLRSNFLRKFIRKNKNFGSNYVKLYNSKINDFL